MRPHWIIALAIAEPACAQGSPGLGTVHAFGDWVVACDNTRRCEAQGYHAEAAPLPAMVSVQRGPGPGAPAVWRIGFGDIDRDGAAEAPKPTQPMTLRAGSLRLTLPAPPPNRPFVDLAPAQAQALRPALLRADVLRLVSAGREWTVSLAGASAALLKMDDLQGRVGTPGALARPGTRPEASVPPAPTPALVKAARLPAPRPADAALLPALRRVLQSQADTCPRLVDNDAADAGEIFRLSDRQVLVVFGCWLAAYNAGSAAWITNDRPPFDPVLARFQIPGDGPPADADDPPAAESFTRGSDGTLTVHAAAKGRGIGDCWSAQEWVWDGQRFALLAAAQSTCRLFTAGGMMMDLWRAEAR